FLGANFRTNREQRASKHIAVFLAQFRLNTITIIAILLQALQRRNGRGENGVEFRAVQLPLLIQSGDAQFHFRLEEIIKAALLDPGFIADLVDGGGTIRARPNELCHGIHQSLSGITYTAHKIFFYFVGELFTRNDKNPTLFYYLVNYYLKI